MLGDSISTVSAMFIAFVCFLGQITPAASAGPTLPAFDPANFAPGAAITNRTGRQSKSAGARASKSSGGSIRHNSNRAAYSAARSLPP